MSKKQLSFESALKKLQTITEELDAADLPLEKSIAKYEEGVRLAQYCESLLSNMEQRIEVITKNSDGAFQAEDIADDFSEDEG